MTMVGLKVDCFHLNPHRWRTGWKWMGSIEWSRIERNTSSLCSQSMFMTSVKNHCDLSIITWGLFNLDVSTIGDIGYYCRIHFHVNQIVCQLFELILVCRPAIREYIKSSRGRWLYWTSYGVFFVTYITMACFKNAGRRYPINLILISILVMKFLFSRLEFLFSIDL
jgi:hypothetical protein